MSRTARFIPAIALIPALLVGCGSKEETVSPEPASLTSATTTAATTSRPTPSTTRSTTTSAPTTSAMARSTSADASGATETGHETEPGTAAAPGDGESAAATTSAASASSGLKLKEEVEPVYDIFASIAPGELFEQFTTCDPTGIEDSFNCSGPEVGQFQFFKSKAKAAQTTQVLTELRSSRVVKDTGDRVVGWSTLGTTAVLTVVDNSQGLVMQQMISTDQDDPEKKIYELGLAEKH